MIRFPSDYKKNLSGAQKAFRRLLFVYKARQKNEDYTSNRLSRFAQVPTNELSASAYNQ